MLNTDERIPMLIAQTGPAAGQRWTLSKPELTIGREPMCDIVIADRQVSRMHARLYRMPDGFELEDLQSKNGTHVNGAPLTGRVRLQDGDLIHVALVAKLIFVGSDATLPLQAAASREGIAALVAPTGPLGRPTGRLRMDSASRRVWVGEKEIDPPLSAPQFRFLELLYQHAGQVVTRENVIEAVWPDAIGSGISEQAIDALVRRLRDRLAELDSEHHYVATVRGHGFRLDNA
jgi:predicted component of type VI protein secretion system